MTAQDPRTAFSEKAFYLQEFRGRTLVFAASVPDLLNPAVLSDVLTELSAHNTRCVVVGGDASGLEKLIGEPPLDGASTCLSAEAWRRLRARPVLGVLGTDPPTEPLGPVARDIAIRLGATKVVVLDAEGGWVGEDGLAASFVSLDQLRARVHGPREGLLAGIRTLLEAGIPAVNLCSHSGLADELFTYAGSGTLFTRERYVDVRSLGIDDFDAAADLVARGVEEGYLTPRSVGEVNEVLASGFGAFVEGLHLAGIGALIPHAGRSTAEIGSLYTLTRFLGEGIGADLIAFALEEARRLGFNRVFACTTSSRVVAFFERNGFARVEATELPEEKWRGYDPVRRARVHCLARDAG